ncbi:MAG: DinB family protein [Balneolaceae bacterium]|nr:DinB family protein [Balneolaceae bacterium]
MSYGVSLVKDNIHFLEQGKELLEDISDEQYVFSDSPYYRSGIGEHMRHILDHYLSLVNHTGDKIDYDARKRDKRIETDKGYAGSIAEHIISRLQSYLEEPDQLQKQVRVRSNEGDSDTDSPWTVSSVKRELQFLISHTVHHYALIAVILRTQDYYPSEEFGIAPSTLEYMKRKSLEQTK